ncbi:MAG: AraC family transcriptional regulator [Betaproteobacteria bacterium]|nr:AraC family transcriptional regulator [Betaproteobacteria bacterium]
MSKHRAPSKGRVVTPLSNVTQEILQTLIKGHSSGAALRVDQMALVSGMGLGDFLKAFKLTFGMTPHQFLLESRMVRAKSLLAEGKALTAVALELGFASHAHFSATFRARTGHTPSAYRLQSKTPRHQACPMAATPDSIRS